MSREIKRLAQNATAVDTVNILKKILKKQKKKELEAQVKATRDEVIDVSD